MSDNIQYYIGTSGWHYDHWKDVFYPHGLPKTRWFEHYHNYFSTVEINATFYRGFKKNTYENWYNQADDPFRYVLKVPRIITHRKYLHNVDGSIREFCESATLLHEKLGMLLLQLAPSTTYDPGLLEKALNAFNDPQKVVVEVRHKRWLTDEFRDMLSQNKITFCNMDSPRLSVLNWITSDKAYFRFHGHTDMYAYNYSDSELKEIAERLSELPNQGVKVAYVFFNNDYEGNAVKNALTLIKLLNG
jgi:uncharacterized protein YecE (DUF72 family)